MTDEPTLTVDRYGSTFELREDGHWYRNGHSCSRELEESPEYLRFRCTPQTFDCSCGTRYVHVCDEAEGCSWVPEGEGIELG